MLQSKYVLGYFTPMSLDVCVTKILGTANDINMIMIFNIKIKYILKTCNVKYITQTQTFAQNDQQRLTYSIENQHVHDVTVY